MVVRISSMVLVGWWMVEVLVMHVVRTENTKVVGYSKVPQTKIL